jgi:hypothetical protein
MISAVGGVILGLAMVETITPDGGFGWQKDRSRRMARFSGLTLSRLAQSARDAAVRLLTSSQVTAPAAGTMKRSATLAAPRCNALLIVRRVPTMASAPNPVALLHSTNGGVFGSPQWARSARVNPYNLASRNTILSRVARPRDCALARCAEVRGSACQMPCFIRKIKRQPGPRMRRN